VVNTSSHPITVDGTRLDTLAYNIEVKSGFDLGTTGRGSNATVPGIDGALWAPNKRETTGRMALAMWVNGTDVDGVTAGDPYEKYRQNMDILRVLFGKRHALLDIRQTLGSTIGTRQALCEVLQAIDPDVNRQGFGRFSVLLEILGAFWQDTADQNYDLNPATTGVKSVTQFAGATAPMRDLQIVLDGPWTSPTVTDTLTGHVLTGATIAAGSQWMIDTTAHTSRTGVGIAFTTGGAQALTTTTRVGAHAPGLFALSPAAAAGTPQITLGGSGLTAASRIRIRGRRKYR